MAQSNTLSSLSAHWTKKRELKAAQGDAELKRLFARIQAIQQMPDVKPETVENAQKQLNLYVLTKYPANASELIG